MSKELKKIISCFVVLLFMISCQCTAFASQNDARFLGSQTIAAKQPDSNGLLFSEDQLDELVKRDIKRIGILTGGGLAPGHNAVISAVVKAAAAKGIEVIGIRRGWEGLYKNKNIRRSLKRGPLTVKDVLKIERSGGSIINTSRFNPFKKSGDTEKAEIMLKNMKEKLKLDAIIACGGDDTCTAAKELTLLSRKLGYNQSFLALPKTIDNDLNIPEESNTYGFRTFVNEGIKAGKSVKEEAMSQKRIMVMEVMGRSAGHIALAVGAEIGAAATLVPEEDPIDFDKLATQIKHYYDEYDHAVIVVSEGAHLQYEGNEIAFDNAPLLARALLRASDNASLDSFGHKKLKYVGRIVTHVLHGFFGKKSTGERLVRYAGKLSYGARAQQIAPTDVAMCTVLGKAAVDYLTEGKDNRLLYVVEKKSDGSRKGDITIQQPMDEEHDDPEILKKNARFVRLQVQDIDLSTDPNLRGRVAMIKEGEKDFPLFREANLARFSSAGTSKRAKIHAEMKPAIWNKKLITAQSKTPGAKRIGIMTSGTMLPGFNTIIASVIRASQRDDSQHQIVGIEEGWRGLVRELVFNRIVKNGFIRDNVSEKILESIEKRGGSILGASSYQLPENYKSEENREVYETIARNVKTLDLDTMIICGGSRTTKSVQRLQQWFLENNINVEIIMLPKVVSQIEGKEVAAVAYGYRSFVDRGSRLVRSIMLEAKALNRIMITDIDEKKDGFAALRMGATNKVTFTFTSESDPIDLKELIQLLQKYYDDNEYGVVLVTEGARLLRNYKNNNYYLDKLFQKSPEMKIMYEESFGDQATFETKGEYIGDILAQIINMHVQPLSFSEESTVATYADEIGLFARSQRVLPEDFNLATQMGEAAYRVALEGNGVNGTMLYIKNGGPARLPITTNISTRSAQIYPEGQEYSKWSQANRGFFDIKSEMPERSLMKAA